MTHADRIQGRAQRFESSMLFLLVCASGSHDFCRLTYLLPPLRICFRYTSSFVINFIDFNLEFAFLNYHTQILSTFTFLTFETMGEADSLNIDKIISVLLEGKRSSRAHIPQR
jgi:hypothetical protein